MADEVLLTNTSKSLCAQIALAHILLAENHPVEHLLVAYRWAFANGALPPCVAEFKLFEKFAESLWSDRGSASNNKNLSVTMKRWHYSRSHLICCIILSHSAFLDATNSMMPGSWHDDCLQCCTSPSCHVRATWAACHTAPGGGSSVKTGIT